MFRYKGYTEARGESYSSVDSHSYGFDDLDLECEIVNTANCIFYNEINLQCNYYIKEHNEV